jgi:hypothetical protein
MVDEETQDVAAGPARAPINRDARPDPGVIEGEIAGRAAHEDGPSAADPGPAPAGDSLHPGARGFAAGAVAGLIISALAAGVGYYVLTSRVDLAGETDRLAGLEARAERDNAAVASLDKRVSALESGASQFGQQLNALEAANAENAPKIAAAAGTAEGLATQVHDLVADIDAARGEIPGLAARVAKLEAQPPAQVNGAGPDLSALAARVDKIETALAAPKSETRVASEKPSSGDNAAAIAIIAGALETRLAAGAPLGSEVGALQRLGVDAAQVAPLQAVANGAATNGALAASFEAAAPKALAAASAGENGGVVDRFLAHARNLVRVRDLNETPGDDPQTLASQIEAASRRGDIAQALAAFGRLPEAARQAAGDWPALARARQAADAALQSIREAAIARLAGSPKP